MKVGELTTQEKESLIGQMVEQDWYFNPFLSYNTTERKKLMVQFSLKMNG